MSPAEKSRQEFIEDGIEFAFWRMLEKINNPLRLSHRDAFKWAVRELLGKINEMDNS